MATVLPRGLSAVATLLLILTVLAAPADAVSTPSPTANEVFAASVSQCPSNRFCRWTGTRYSGSFASSRGSGVTKSLGTTVNSFWNNRSRAVRLYNNAGSASICYAAGAKRGSLPTSYQKPAKVTLSSGTSC